MNLKSLPLIFGVLHSLIASLQAGPRASASYSVKTDTIDSAGRRATSASYSNDGGLGGVVGVSTVAAPVETVKHGYIGQLYEVTALQLVATPATVNENTMRQLSGAQLLDDSTTLAVPAESIAWSIVSGPLSIGLNTGSAMAGTVYEDTAATVQGIYAGYTGLLGLTVLNVNNDDVPGYGGDGLDDAWQVQYFGLSNPDAAPLLDPDGDGHNNLFEFTAGINPTSGNSRFLMSNAAVPGQPGQMTIVINPRFADRIYTVKTSTSLDPGAEWTTLTTVTITDDGNERTITDTSATGGAKYYVVEIVKP